MPKEKSEYFLYAVLGILVVVLLFSVGALFKGPSSQEQGTPEKGNFVQQKVAPPQLSSSGSPFTQKTTGTTGEGDVEISLSPKKPDGSQLEVGIAVNTHSVDLSPFDLKDITTLTFKGKTIKPTDAPALEGHHASGTLRFERVEGIGNEFSISIKGIPKVMEREFNWR